MNKRMLTLMLVPLMLLPLVGFGYAHWTDTVEKRYKLRAGTVKIHIIQWHIDKCTSYDCNCNGVLVGDEIKIVPIYDADDQVIGLWIKADPIFPCWELELKMLVHVKGRLAVRFEEPKIVFKGPYDTDPCFDPIVDGIPYNWTAKEFPGIPWFTYKCQMFRRDPLLPPMEPPGPDYDKSHYTDPAAPTEFRYKPCECIMIKQYLHLKQATDEFTQEELQEMLSCKWLRIDFELEAINEVGLPWGSEGEEYPHGWVPYEDGEVIP